jgi:hypothetical protein
MRLALLLAGALLLWPATPSPAAQSQHVYAVRLDGHFVYKPRTLGQGAHGLFEHLRWRHWDGPAATSSALFDYADAYDHFTAPVRVTLSRIGHCGRHRVYRRLTVRAARASDRHRLSFTLGTFPVICP